MYQQNPGTAAPAEEDVDPISARILEGALAQFGDFGIRRTTVEDIARRLGISRVTIYRHFPRKALLIEAVLLREQRCFLTELEAAVAHLDNSEDRIVEGFAFALLTLREHPLIARLLRTEPETLLPHLTREGGPVLAVGTAFLAAQIRSDARARPTEAEAERIAEVMCRLVLSFMLTPDSAIPLRTRSEMRTFAREYVVPMFAGLTRGPRKR